MRIYTLSRQPTLKRLRRFKRNRGSTYQLSCLLTYRITDTLAHACDKRFGRMLNLLYLEKTEILFFEFTPRLYDHIH
jgi:hypothetical protein